MARNAMYGLMRLYPRIMRSTMPIMAPKPVTVASKSMAMFSRENSHRRSESSGPGCFFCQGREANSQTSSSKKPRIPTIPR